MLTPKQHALLQFIARSLEDTGVAPSFEEMKNHMSLKSKSGIHRLISVLEEQHRIRRLPGKARAVELIPAALRNAGAVHHEGVSLIPLAGKIAAGLPIEAVATGQEDVCVPPQLMGSGEHYALLVEGDSMKDAGIMDGDTVIIRKASQAPDGTIVVALIDGYEVTLKRLRTKGCSIALEPANEAYETRIFSPDRIEIQGRLAGLMRAY